MSVSGLFIIFEILKGAGIFLDANKDIANLAERFISVAKILEKKNVPVPRDESSDAGTHSDANPTSAAQCQVQGVLDLLSIAQMTFRVAELRSHLGTLGKHQLLGSLAFFKPDADKPLYLREIQTLEKLTLASRGTVEWNNKTSQVVISGLVDRNPAAGPGSTVLTLTLKENLARIRLTDRDLLEFQLIKGKASTVAPVGWQASLPVLQVWRNQQSTSDIAAELVAEIVFVGDANIMKRKQ